ncbi:hypothetical protein ACFY84_35545 [Streptomyces sp. NPDC012438]|uniref:hypothetical protein n=1 Tax=Streptomyces sp. NPDC012438 TaxID=3364833 RepID=UPI0036E386D1
MFTARAASSTTRIRRPAGPLPLLWLGALLLALLYTHTAGADSATAHTPTAPPRRGCPAFGNVRHQPPP